MEFNTMNEKRILFVDDEVKILTLMDRAFSKAGYTVKTAPSAKEALEILHQEDIHVMFFDLNMPEMNGLELCRLVKQERPMALVFALTGYASLFELAECREAGFDDYFIKPADLKTLKAAAETAYSKLNRWKKR